MLRREPKGTDPEHHSRKIVVFWKRQTGTSSSAGRTERAMQAGTPAGRNFKNWPVPCLAAVRNLNSQSKRWRFFRMTTFKAIRIDKADKGTTVALTQFDEAELMDGNVVVRVDWSTLNYKDGLAVTGKAPVVRRFPMIAGIDFAGTVKTSSHPDCDLQRLGHGRNPSWRLCG